MFEFDEKFHSFIDNSSDGIALIDVDGKVIEWNKMMESITGILKGNALGQYSWEVMFSATPESQRGKFPLEDFKKQILQAVRTGNADFFNRRSEVVLQMEGKTMSIIDQRVFPMRTDNGYMLGIIARDDTESSLTKKALAESEEKFRNIFNSTNDGIYIIDEDGNFLEANDKYCEQRGYTMEEMLRMNLAQITKPELVGTIPQRMEAARKSGHLLFESVHLTKAGAELPVEINTKLITYQGKPCRLGVARDIGKRERAAEGAEWYGELYRMFIDNAREAIFSIDLEGRFRMVNRAAARAMGLRPDEVIGKYIEDLFPADEANRGLENLERVIRTGKGHTFESLVHTPEGQRWFATRIDPVISSSGKIDSVLLVGIDITDQKGRENAFQQANRQLNLMTSATRHDMVNQLMVLKGYVELLEKGRTEVNGHDIFPNIRKTIDSLEAKLEFMKQYQDIGVKEPSWQNLREIIRFERSQLELGGLTITEEGTDVQILADTMLEKVVLNLIDNVIRHGRKATLLEIRTEVKDGDLKVIFQDNGAGISEKDRAHLFERGYGKHSGYGLFISREILGITGIDIEEKSGKGSGARFELTVRPPNYQFLS